MPIDDDARQRVRRLSTCSLLASKDRWKKAEIFSRDTRPTFLAGHARFVVESNGSIIESAIRASGSLECSDASLYIREAGGCQWSVYGASWDLNKRSVCKVRGLSIRASAECEKSRRFQTKGISGSDRVEVFLMPVTLVCLLLHPWKRGSKSEIVSEQTRSSPPNWTCHACAFSDP